jgi:hypothetical protein
MGDYLPGQPLSRKMSKKYAICKRKFELGIWGHDLNLLKGVYLTTWSEAKQSKGKFVGQSKNNYRFLREDMREMKRQLLDEGLVYESCFCPEYSPKSHLLHTHGFMRFEKIIRSAELHGVISRVWGKVHDSPVVYVKDIYSVKQAVEYDLKDAVKNYVQAESFGGRVLCSRGWLPSGWKEVQKILWSWCSEVKYPDWVKTGEDVYNFELMQDEDGAHREYVYLAKEIMNDYLYRWCCGEAIKLELFDRTIFIQGTEIYERMDSDE